MDSISTRYCKTTLLHALYAYIKVYQSDSSLTVLMIPCPPSPSPSDPAKFDLFFKSVISLVLTPPRVLSLLEKTVYTRFIINAFASLEEEIVRTIVLSLVGLPLVKLILHKLLDSQALHVLTSKYSFASISSFTFSLTPCIR